MSEDKLTFKLEALKGITPNGIGFELLCLKGSEIERIARIYDSICIDSKVMVKKLLGKLPIDYRKKIETEQIEELEKMVKQEMREYTKTSTYSP